MLQLIKLNIENAILILSLCYHLIKSTMATAKKAAKKINTPGDSLAKTVTAQLSTSLTSLKEKLGEKKFKKRIKKAAKKLVAGIKKTEPKKAVKKANKTIPVKKKAAKPATKK
jgi:hypothetical protein